MSDQPRLATHIKSSDVWFEFRTFVGNSLRVPVPWQYGDMTEHAAGSRMLAGTTACSGSAVACFWTDFDLGHGHGFHETRQVIRFTISKPARREVLQRLLKLNHERYAEEVKKVLHHKNTMARKSKKSQPATQMLFGDLNDQTKG